MLFIKASTKWCWKVDITLDNSMQSMEIDQSVEGKEILCPCICAAKRYQGEGVWV